MVIPATGTSDTPDYAFTEHGAIMAATVLNSPDAVRMSVFVVRAFVKMREYLMNRAELEKRLTDIEKTLLAHDAALRDVYQPEAGRAAQHGAISGGTSCSN